MLCQKIRGLRQQLHREQLRSLFTMQIMLIIQMLHMLFLQFRCADHPRLNFHLCRCPHLLILLSTRMGSILSVETALSEMNESSVWSARNTRQPLRGAVVPPVANYSAVLRSLLYHNLCRFPRVLPY